MNSNVYSPYTGLDTNLILNFGHERWTSLSAEQCLESLQQLEIQTARMEQRPTVRIRVLSASQATGGLLGYYSHAEGCMYIHPRYVQPSKLILGDYGAAAAIRTVLHEGRHGFQWSSVRSGSGRVPMDVLTEWAVNECRYFGGNGSEQQLALYFLQPVELDARRFARERAGQIQQQLADLTGSQDESFRRSMDADQRSEAAIRALGKRVLTPSMLDRAEEEALAAFKRYNPQKDAAGVRIFHEAREMLFPDGAQSFGGFNLPPQWGLTGLAASYDAFGGLGGCGSFGCAPGSWSVPGMF